MTTKPLKDAIDRHYRVRSNALVRDAQASVDMAILMTPSGELRNKLTEVNLLLMQCEELIKKGTTHV